MQAHAQEVNLPKPISSPTSLELTKSAFLPYIEKEAAVLTVSNSEELLAAVETANQTTESALEIKFNADISLTDKQLTLVNRDKVHIDPNKPPDERIFRAGIALKSRSGRITINGNGFSLTVPVLADAAFFTKAMTAELRMENITIIRGHGEAESSALALSEKTRYVIFSDATQTTLEHVLIFNNTDTSKSVEQDVVGGVAALNGLSASDVQIYNLGWDAVLSKGNVAISKLLVYRDDAALQLARMGGAGIAVISPEHVAISNVDITNTHKGVILIRLPDDPILPPEDARISIKDLLLRLTRPADQEGSVLYYPVSSSGFYKISIDSLRMLDAKGQLAGSMSAFLGVAAMLELHNCYLLIDVTRSPFGASQPVERSSVLGLISPNELIAINSGILVRYKQGYMVETYAGDVTPSEFQEEFESQGLSIVLDKK